MTTGAIAPPVTISAEKLCAPSGWAVTVQVSVPSSDLPLRNAGSNGAEAARDGGGPGRRGGHSATLAVIVGTLGAVGLTPIAARLPVAAQTLILLPILLPEVITGLSLLLFFLLFRIYQKIP